MSEPTYSSLPKADQEKAIDAVLNLLKSDPTLRSISTTVRAEIGDRDTMMDKMPDVTELPCIQVFDGEYSVEIESERRHHGVLTVHCFLYTPNHYADRFRFWQAFVSALFPAHGSEQHKYRQMLASGIGSLKSRGVKIQSGGSKIVPIGADQFARQTHAALVFPFDFVTPF
jgi:uncharacterized membrane protein